MRKIFILILSFFTISNLYASTLTIQKNGAVMRLYGYDFSSSQASYYQYQSYGVLAKGLGDSYNYGRGNYIGLLEKDGYWSWIDCGENRDNDTATLGDWIIVNKYYSDIYADISTVADYGDTQLLVCGSNGWIESFSASTECYNYNWDKNDDNSVFSNCETVTVYMNSSDTYMETCVLSNCVCRYGTYGNYPSCTYCSIATGNNNATSYTGSTDTDGKLTGVTTVKASCDMCAVKNRITDEREAKTYFINNPGEDYVLISAYNILNCPTGTVTGTYSPSEHAIAAVGCPSGQVPTGTNFADFNKLFKMNRLSGDTKDYYKRDDGYFTGVTCTTCAAKASGVTGLQSASNFEESVYSSFYGSYVTTQNSCLLKINDGTGVLDCAGF